MPKGTTQDIRRMRGSRKFYQRGSNFDGFFVFVVLVDKGREDPNTTISGSSLNLWRLAGVPMTAQHECWF